MNYNQDFIKLVESLKLTKIQVIETQTQRLADPEAGIPELKYKIDHLMGEGDPIPLDPNQLIFHSKVEVYCRSKETDIAHIMIAFVILFEKTNDALFTELWAQPDIKKIFENQQLKKTLWPYVRQFVTESLQRLELPAITLPWMI